jgi:hypothetical protein
MCYSQKGNGKGKTIISSYFNSLNVCRLTTNQQHVVLEGFPSRRILSYKRQKQHFEAYGFSCLLLLLFCSAFTKYASCSERIVRESCGDETAQFTKRFLEKMSNSLMRVSHHQLIVNVLSVH